MLLRVLNESESDSVREAVRTMEFVFDHVTESLLERLEVRATVGERLCDGVSCVRDLLCVNSEDLLRVAVRNVDDSVGEALDLVRVPVPS